MYSKATLCTTAFFGGGVMNFKEARLRAGITAVEASEKLNVSRQAVFSWENGIYMPEAKRLTEIAKLYGCTVDELLDTGREDFH